MIILFITHILLQIVDPSNAVERISNESILGSVLVIVLSLLIPIAIFTVSKLTKVFNTVNSERREYMEENKKLRDENLAYVISLSNTQTEVIRNYSETREASLKVNEAQNILLEKIITIIQTKNL